MATSFVWWEPRPGDALVGSTGAFIYPYFFNLNTLNANSAAVMSR